MMNPLFFFLFMSLRTSVVATECVTNRFDINKHTLPTAGRKSRDKKDLV